jgi:DNA-binding beta-propeller fold protein YncE
MNPKTILQSTRETTPRKEWKRSSLVVLLAVPMTSIGILMGSPFLGFGQVALPYGVSSPTPSATPTPPPNNVVYTFNTDTNPEGIAISPNSETLYVACPGANTVDVVNAAISTYPITATLTNPASGNLVYVPRGITLNPAGTTLYVAVTNGEYSSGSIIVYDTTQSTYPSTVITTQGSPNTVTVTPDGTLLYVTEENFNTSFFGVEEFSTSTEALVNTITTGGYPQDLEFTNSGQQADVLNFAGSGGLQFIDTTSQTLSSSVVGGRIFYPAAMTINAATTKLYVADGDNYITACNAATGAATGTFLFGPGPLSSAVPGQPAVTPNGHYLYIPQVSPAESGYQVVVLNAMNGAIVGSPIPVGNVPVATAAAPNGKRVYVSNSSDSTVTVVSTKP